MSSKNFSQYLVTLAHLFTNSHFTTMHFNIKVINEPSADEVPHVLLPLHQWSSPTLVSVDHIHGHTSKLIARNLSTSNLRCCLSHAWPQPPTLPLLLTNRGSGQYMPWRSPSSFPLSLSQPRLVQPCDHQHLGVSGPNFDNCQNMDEPIILWWKKNTCITKSRQWASQKVLLSTYTWINSKLIISLNIKYKTVHLFEQNIGENLQDLGLGNESLDWPSEV